MTSVEKQDYIDKPMLIIQQPLRKVINEVSFEMGGVEIDENEEVVDTDDSISVLESLI